MGLDLVGHMEVKILLWGALQEIPAGWDGDSGTTDGPRMM
jgi:uncharacterized protein YbdZ (MbtH family)